MKTFSNTEAELKKKALVIKKACISSILYRYNKPPLTIVIDMKLLEQTFYRTPVNSCSYVSFYFYFF